MYRKAWLAKISILQNLDISFFDMVRGKHMQSKILALLKNWYFCHQEDKWKNWYCKKKVSTFNASIINWHSHKNLHEIFKITLIYNTLYYRPFIKMTIELRLIWSISMISKMLMWPFCSNPEFNSMSDKCSWNGSYKPVAPIIYQTTYLSRLRSQVNGWGLINFFWEKCSG